MHAIIFTLYESDCCFLYRSVFVYNLLKCLTSVRLLIRLKLLRVPSLSNTGRDLRMNELQTCGYIGFQILLVFQYLCFYFRNSYFKKYICKHVFLLSAKFQCIYRIFFLICHAPL